MGTYKAPGVFVKRVSGTTPQIVAASPSNFGCLGWSPRGPENEAVLCSNYAAFARRFGEPTKNSILAIEADAFFKNLGERFWAVRVPPADAVKANGALLAQYRGILLKTITAFSPAATVTVAGDASELVEQDGLSPIVPDSLTIKWRTSDADVVDETIKDALRTDDLVLVDGQAGYEGRLVQGPDEDPTLDSYERASVTIAWDPDGVGDRTITVTGTASSRVTTAANGQGSVVTFDHRSGRVSIRFAGTDIPDSSGDGGDIRADYTTMTDTKSAVATGAVDVDGFVNLTHADLTAGIVNNYFNIITGAWQLKWASNTPLVGAVLVVDYDVLACQLEAASSGVWGNGLRLTVEGNPNALDAATAVFSRYDVTLSVLNSKTLKYEPKEFFDNVSLSDADDDRYFPVFVNETSDLMTVVVPSGDLNLPQLSGVAHSDVFAGGNGLSAQSVYGEVLAPSIVPGSVVITWYDSTGTAFEITDDGLGNLAGDIDVSYVTEVNAISANTVNYVTGALNFRTADTIRAGTLVVVAYVNDASASSYVETLGDIDQNYSYAIDTAFEMFRAGVDGTFDSTNWSRNQFSNSTLLEADKLGLFALNTVEEIMQVAIPDFAGNATITGDLIDYAEGRADQSSGADRFVLFSPPAGYSAALAVRWFKTVLARETSFGALYVPWIYVPSPFNPKRTILVPPMAHVAGVYAKVDKTRGVGKAPAGKADGKLNFLSLLEYNFDEIDRGLLNSNRINVIRNDLQVQNAVFSAVTASTDDEFRLIHARRLFMSVGRSLYNSSHWAVFEPNNATLWNAMKGQAISYLNSLFNSNQLGGDTPADAFNVVCDETINTRDTVKDGFVFMDVQIKPPKMAEFIEFRVAQLQDV